MNLPFVSRLLSTVLSSYVPYTLYIVFITMFSDSNLVGVREVVWSMLSLLVMVAAYAIIRSSSTRASVLWVVLGDLCVFCGWWWMVSWTSLGLWVVLVFVLWFRVRRLVGNSLLPGLRFDFRLDSILLIFTGAVLGLRLASSGHGTEWASAWMTVTMFYLIGRMVHLWQLERQLTATQGATHWTLLWTGTTALLVALISPWILKLYWLMMIAGATAGGILGVLLGARIHLQPQSGIQSVTPSSAVSSFHAQTVVSHPVVPLAAKIAFYILLSVGGLLITWWAVRMVRVKPMRSFGKDDTEPPISVQRAWVSNPSEPRFVSTKDPVRLQYQNWLRRQFARGLPMNEQESARQYLQRLIGLNKESPGQIEEELTHTYERVRYR